MAPDTAELVASIYDAAWWVRHHQRGARSSTQRLERAQAIQRLGLTVREVFNASEDFEPLLIALFDGLSQRNAPPF